MAFRNFLKSNRFNNFAHTFGRHSNRVAQQDFNATVIDYIAELESQIAELNGRLDLMTRDTPSERAMAKQKKQRQFQSYQKGERYYPPMKSQIGDDNAEYLSDITAEVAHDDAD